ncbi:hypothetical protein OPS25_15545 [Alteromonas ponticola]|uniref:DUF2946 domain-containing protein n=1 Tax=Alteromonas aquimaris TaxID=2998417 RepID=A0ABT3PBG6_9ALTE|nr:hypothetical protein [Alteromonas aquimaris]MCW8109920.1 hypothetical protein [Alteromonas aquimaris]
MTRSIGIVLLLFAVSVQALAQQYAVHSNSHSHPNELSGSMHQMQLVTESNSHSNHCGKNLNDEAIQSETCCEEECYCPPQLCVNLPLFLVSGTPILPNVQSPEFYLFAGQATRNIPSGHFRPPIS